MGTVAARLEAVRRQVADAADVSGRVASDVTIVAVTKTVGIEDIRAAADAGACDFGENRVQEFLGKYGLFPDIDWHFIGTLQTNKVKDIVGRASLIHSVDSVRLLEEVSKRASAIDCVQHVLLQVNVSGEQSKHGFEPAELTEALVAASSMPGLLVRGLMTMAPFGRPEDARWVFRELKDVRDSLREMPLNGVELDELSMGMTNDFKVAVEEGSTIVRVGRAIFGR
ncbi:MAG TPA: YggS family pyridoxal phosphate-dependent enzyme [Coriobacteriia bacterium]|nr:YggS family pyridoxal phosphate-dependent enzyme [Coriobacteriia bacterium]